MILKIALMGIAVCFISIILKRYTSEFLLPTEIVFLSVSLILLLDIFKDISDTVFDYLSAVRYGDEIISSVIKGVGISLLTRFSSDICLENGNKLVADVIDFSGRVMLMAIALPYIKAVTDVAIAFLK